ncbi:MAG: glycosyltransferase family 2 protein [Clostridiaceae bacterium]|nr:glycosyltransferase family 2 protein [Clostridiaceae bacterium]
MEPKTLYILAPCYNEAEVLPLTSKIFLDKLNSLITEGKISENSRVAFVDDGSKDETWNIIESLHELDPKFIGVKLSRNRGHQNALLGGMSTVADDCDMIVTIDADAQDDVNAIDKMVDDFNGGAEIVYGVRASRETDTFFKRTTAQGFYKFMTLMGVETVYNHADFRLMSSRAVKALLDFKEVNLFLRGMVPLVGFKSSTVTYDRAPRLAGESKYPLKKMLTFAFDGITSFSIRPIRFITALGGITLILSVIFAIYALISYFVHNTVPGWTSTVISIWFFGSLQLIATGVVGEYIGKIYLETKGRPRFFIEKYLK